ncbi:hypothetical protein NP493_2047g00009 [Ridgeia piscesae]|uniref:Uncharacterized protein n=1 Tax=Ridgeia piscesae TaxID=27915 RepID=A0AAD9N3V4_RIDPI|nr:hypothetical protein NP493_2047g00009 [Ridgeia piscesae]
MIFDVGFVEACVFLILIVHVVYILTVFIQSYFSSLTVSRIYSALQLRGMWYTSSPCSANSTLSFGCTNKRLRVVWGRRAVANLYLFITLCTLPETTSTYGITT